VIDFRTAVRRHYERLETSSEGFLALGDAICGVKPIYGQEMAQRQ
jgi:hypothetical protein